ncbi:MAG: DUF4926 domain-containing protein [Clostridiales Family XIII bacterium]|jgi:hypothetical protein|nr:DUF4926 domain-containing protein [Clostridiales Family XIII bacterium]
MLDEYAIVKAERDLSDKVLKGCQGTVVLVHTSPKLGYEVEFVDDEGDTLAVLTVYPADIAQV